MEHRGAADNRGAVEHRGAAEYRRDRCRPFVRPA
ncbi:hypothetical protein K701_13010 [Streptomyces fradiae ATCC 10745 = DSM 40063]|uniref:Uncharacterized protein n=1 Tax=Streptomyces fradiae ATCC 10745 = DSM 40063 TaxID=1319510 RepID=A0ABQ6XUT2_STRFR|nr:hypothetical protein K701_13010 [Streptomyces fradiae ATCC 10745 = DSM 40063]